MTFSFTFKGVPSGCPFPLRTAIQRPRMAGSGEEMEGRQKAQRVKIYFINFIFRLWKTC